MVRLPEPRRAQAGAALGRPAPARRARPRDRQRAGGAAARRAARRARPEAAPGDAARAQADPARGRDHLRLRHPRPGGGADDERPPGRDERRPDRAARHAGRGLRAPARTSSSPGFIGVSNLLERDGRRFTIRPEKVGCCRPAAAPAAGAARRSRARSPMSIYLGAVTRYVVELDGGEHADRGPPEPGDRRRGDALERAARACTATWREAQTFTIDTRPRDRRRITHERGEQP